MLFWISLFFNILFVRFCLLFGGLCRYRCNNINNNFFSILSLSSILKYFFGKNSKIFHCKNNKK